MTIVMFYDGGHMETHLVTLILQDAVGTDVVDFDLNQPGDFQAISITSSFLTSNDNIQGVGCIDARSILPAASTALTYGDPIRRLRIVAHKIAGTAGNSNLFLTITVWIKDTNR